MGDQKILGVDVTVGLARVSICRGFVNLANVVINNPEGFQTPYLLSVGEVCVKLGVWTLIKSGGKKVVVEALILKKVDVIYEKSSTSSNVDEIVHHLERDKKEETPEEKK